jgi:WD40 repeat protein
VFFSEQEMPPGERLDSALQTALFHSRALVVIANRGTLQDPRWVRKEVEEYRHRHPDRPVIPINVGGALQDSALNESAQEWIDYQGKVWVDETEEAVASGIASERVVNRLTIVPRLSRVNVRWRWVVSAIVTLLSCLLVVAITAAWIADRNAKKAKIQADRALAGQLAVQSQSTLSSFPQRSLLLATVSSQRARKSGQYVPLSVQALLDSLSSTGGIPLRSHETPVDYVAFSPDGKRLAAGGHDISGEGGSVRVWDLTKPGTEPLILSDHEHVVTAVTFSPDGIRLATVGRDIHSNVVSIRVWDLTKPGAEPLTLHAHEFFVDTVAFSPDGKRLTSGGRDMYGEVVSVRVWDLSKPETEPLTLQTHASDVYVDTVAFSPDGIRLATVGRDLLSNLGSVRVWDLAKPGTKPLMLLVDGSSVRSVAFSSNGKRLGLVSTSIGKWILPGKDAVRIWDLTKPEAQPFILRYEGYVDSIAFSPDDKRLAAGTRDLLFGEKGIIRIWDLNNPKADPLILHGHEGTVSSIAFTPDGKQLASGSSDMTVRIWDVMSPQVEPIMLHDHESFVYSVAFSPNGERLASGSKDKKVRIWDLINLQVEPLILGGHEGPVSFVAFTADGKRLASGSEEWGLEPQTVRIWDLNTPEANPLILKGLNDYVAIALSPDGKRLVSFNEIRIIFLPTTFEVRVWDLNNPEAEPLILHGLERLYRSPADRVAFSPDGKRLAVSDIHGKGVSVRVWDLTKPGTNPLTLNGHEGAGSPLVFSPDGKRLAAGSIEDKTVRIWDLSKLTAEPLILRGEEQSVSSLAFSFDGKRLASGSRDVVRIWDLTKPETQPLILHHVGSVSSIEFSPDGKRLAAGSEEDNTVRIWDVDQFKLEEHACLTAGRNFTCDEWQQFFGEEPYRPACPELLYPKDCDRKK